MSMSIYAMNYYNDSMQNKQSGTKTKETDMKQEELQENWGSAQLTREKYREDGTVSMVKRMQGTEAYLQVKAGQTNSQVLDSTSEELLYSDAVRTDTVMISQL